MISSTFLLKKINPKLSRLSSSYYLTGILVFVCNMANAQNTKALSEKQLADKELAGKKIDSVKMSYLKQAALRFPLLRQGGISKEIVGREKVTSELYGNKLAESEVRISRIRANFNIPIMTSGKNTVGASVGLLQQRLDFENTRSFNDQYPVSDNRVDKTTINLSAFAARSGTLFSKPVSLSANISVLTDQMASTFRINLIAAATMTLKRTATTSYSVGLLVLINPSAPTPLLPYFNYWHKFDNDLEFFLDLPTRLAIRKQVTKKASLALGTEISGTTAFLNLKEPGLPQKNLYATLELKTGPTFEYLVSKNIVLGVSGGLFNTVTSRVYERSAKSDDYFIKNKMGSTPYINFSISVLPFLKGI